MATTTSLKPKAAGKSRLPYEVDFDITDERLLLDHVVALPNDAAAIRAATERSVR